MLTTAERRTTISTEPPSTPRLRLNDETSGRRLLDGGWWPRTTDPVAELPGLLMALETERGPITHVLLARVGWDTQPRRLGVGDKVVRLGWFTSQPLSLLTATRANGDRVDLLVVPPGTSEKTAKNAMAIASRTANAVQAPEILAAAEKPARAATAAERPNQPATPVAATAEGNHGE